MLNNVKQALRISNSEFDSEIDILIEACKDELKSVGVASSLINSEDNPLITQAIITYCKANFGYDNPDAQRFNDSYEKQKIFLSTNKYYKE